MGMKNNAVLVRDGDMGYWYQVIRVQGEVRFYCVGRFGAETGELQNPASPRAIEADDVVIPEKEIIEWTLRANTEEALVWQLDIRTSRKKYCFCLQEDMLEGAQALLKGAGQGEMLDSPNAFGRRRKLRLVCWAMVAVSVAAFVMQVFLGEEAVVSKLMMLLSLLCFPAGLVLYLMFPKDIAEMDSKNKPNQLVDVSLAMTISILPNSLGILSNNMESAARWLLTAAAAGAVMTLLYVCINRKLAVRALSWVLIMFMFIYAIIMVPAVNCRLDFHEPERHRTVVYSMDTDVSGGRRKYRTYEVEVHNGTERVEYNVSGTLYRRLQPGDWVDIVTYPGLLGIEHVVIEPAE